MENTPDHPSFDQWRVVPNDETLLFNFKDKIHSEDDAIDLIIACCGKESIMGIRRLCSESIKDWIVIEVCFASNEARAQAITKGVALSNYNTIFPITTCTAKYKCTVLYFKGMCLYSQQERIESDIRVWAAHVLLDAKKTKRITASASPITEKKTKDIWMEIDSNGFYRGDCVAIIDGVDKRFVEAYDNFVWFFPDAAADYPKVRTFVKQCSMYCTSCKTIDLHFTKDCDAINARVKVEENDSQASAMKKEVPDDDDDTQANQKNEVIDEQQLDEKPSKDLKGKLQLEDKMHHKDGKHQEQRKCQDEEKHQEEEDDEEDYCCVYSTAELTRQ